MIILAETGNFESREKLGESRHRESHCPDGDLTMKNKKVLLWAAGTVLVVQTAILYSIVALTHDEAIPLGHEGLASLHTRLKARSLSSSSSSSPAAGSLPSSFKASARATCPRPLKPVDRSNPYYVVNGSPLWDVEEDKESAKNGTDSLLIVSCMIQDPRALVAIASQLQCWASTFDKVILTFPEYGRSIVEPFLQKWRDELAKNADSKTLSLLQNTIVSRYYVVTGRYEMGVWCDMMELFQDAPPRHVVLATVCLFPVSTQPIMESMLEQVQTGSYDLVGITVRGNDNNNDRNNNVQDTDKAKFGSKLDPFVYAVPYRIWNDVLKPHMCRISTSKRWGYQYPEDYIRVPFYRDHFQQTIQSLFDSNRILALYEAPDQIPAPVGPTAEDMKNKAKKPDTNHARKIALWKDGDWKRKVLDVDELFPVGKTFGQIPEGLSMDDEDDKAKAAILQTCLGGSETKMNEIFEWAEESFSGTTDTIAVSVC